MVLFEIVRELRHRLDRSGRGERAHETCRAAREHERRSDGQGGFRPTIAHPLDDSSDKTPGKDGAEDHRRGQVTAEGDRRSERQPYESATTAEEPEHERVVAPQ